MARKKICKSCGQETNDILNAILESQVQIGEVLANLEVIVNAECQKTIASNKICFEDCTEGTQIIIVDCEENITIKNLQNGVETNKTVADCPEYLVTTDTACKND